VRGYTAGEPIVEIWRFWRQTGQFPWPNAFYDAVASDVEELLYLERCYNDMVNLRSSDARPNK
jgi:hypothetical protein